MKAGIPSEAIGLYPGGHDCGGAIMTSASRSMIFGSLQTIEQYAGNPKVQVHGPGFSKIILGDDIVDDWEQYLDVMIESIFINGGRGCINCSGIWASRHTKEIAAAIAERLGPVDVKSPDDPEASLAAFTNKAQGTGTWDLLKKDLEESGVTDMTSQYGDRFGRTGEMFVSQACHRPLCFTRVRHRFQGIHVPVHLGRGMSSRSNDQKDGIHAGLHSSDQGPADDPTIDRFDPYRSAQHWRDSYEQVELVATARRQHY